MYQRGRSTYKCGGALARFAGSVEGGGVHGLADCGWLLGRLRAAGCRSGRCPLLGQPLPGWACLKSPPGGLRLVRAAAESGSGWFGPLLVRAAAGSGRGWFGPRLV